tara:strand:+ start:692 stop:1012 length:321 start_codon:yes stop_codon:yes gene_type:complete
MNLITQYAPNQILIETEEAIYLQSYKSIVAKYDKETKIVFLGYDWDYSRTTMKYVKKFIGQCSKAGNNFAIKDLKRALREESNLLGIRTLFKGGLKEEFYRLNVTK